MAPHMFKFAKSEMRAKVNIDVAQSIGQMIRHDSNMMLIHN